MILMRSRLKLHRFFFICVLIAWLAVVLVVFATPVAFSGSRKDQSAAPFWYWFSESGGVIGSTILIIAISFALMLAFDKWWKRLLAPLVSFLAFAILLGSLAYMNEHFVKTSVKAHRPSHRYLTSALGIDIENFYKMDESDRSRILSWETCVHPEKTSDIYPLVLNHWIHESGYSFPSGHSQNAFLLATIVAFIIYINAKEKLRYLAMIPLVWAALVCISRVAIGIHTSYDVTAGSALGMMTATVIILSGIPQRFLQRNRHTIQLAGKSYF